MRLSHILSALLGVVAAVSAPWACADSLTVQDTSGFTRAAEDVSGPSKVEFNLTDSSGAPAEGVPVTLSSPSGEVLSATAVAGTAIFDAVGPGLWTVATASQGVVFTNVAVTGGIVAAGTSTGVAAGAAALAVGGGSVAIAASRSSDSGTELSPAS